MRIMLDTNILISALAFKGRVYRVIDDLQKNSKHDILVSAYVENEFKKKISVKWADRAEEIFKDYESLRLIRCKSTDQILGKVRDEKDIPVLSDAIFHEVDILLTGDKDFLESGIKNPLIMSPTLLFEYMQK